eukprot:s325_g36.t3
MYDNNSHFVGRIGFHHLHPCGQDSLKLFLNDEVTPFATLKHQRKVVKIPVEVLDPNGTIRFEGKLWYAQDAKGKQLLFKASRAVASLADQEVGLVAGHPLGEFEVFTFNRQSAEVPKAFQQKNGYRRVEIYVFHDDANISYRDDTGEHRTSLAKHSITELWLPWTFCCEIPRKMKREYEQHEFHQKKFMAFDPAEPDDLLAADVDLARALLTKPVPETALAEEAPAEAPRVELETRSEDLVVLSLHGMATVDYVVHHVAFISAGLILRGNCMLPFNAAVLMAMEVSTPFLNWVTFFRHRGEQYQSQVIGAGVMFFLTFLVFRLGLNIYGTILLVVDQARGLAMPERVPMWQQVLVILAILAGVVVQLYWLPRIWHVFGVRIWRLITTGSVDVAEDEEDDDEEESELK